jgi:40S ribosomal protein S4 C-terminus/KOW motif
MVTGGRNMGRVGVVTHRERHDGGFNIVHIKDAIENSFATRESNVFIIGQDKPWVSLPKGKGVKVSSTSMQHALSTAHSFYSFLSPRSEIAAGL